MPHEGHEGRNVRLIVEYDGTDFHGSQCQAPGVRTVQGVLVQALAETLGHVPKLIFASRTDAGVHAKGQCVNFTTASRIPIERLPLALATRLPPDVGIVKAEAVPATFHARFDALEKTYRYWIWQRPTPSPFARRFAWQVPWRLDVAAMQAAAESWIGRHAFDAFASAGRAQRTSVRELRRLTVAHVDDAIEITASADGFLYNMVRILVGTLVEIGRGRRSAADAPAILASGERAQAGETAPPHGLCLLEVRYALDSDVSKGIK